jgi:phenylalanyl-tRNA synthetase beta chain
MNVLRPSLLPGLLDALRHNLNHKTSDVALFEIGRVFLRHHGRTAEKRNLAVALTGSRAPLFWQGADRDAKFDIFDLKGILEEFYEAFGLRGISCQRAAEPGKLFLEAATVHLGKLTLGRLGLVRPNVARQYDLRDPLLMAELDLDEILARRNAVRSFKSLPAFPAIRRDIAMLLPEATTHDAVVQTVKQTRAANLESVELFDVFRGKNVPEGQKSLAYAFTYRSSERTLTDAEVNAAHEKVLEQLRQKLDAGIRDQ